MPHKSAQTSFLCCTDFRRHRQGGGDSPPTFCSILSKTQNCENTHFSRLHHRFTVCMETLCFHRSSTAKRFVFTYSPPVHKMAFSRRFTAAGRFWTFLSNSFLSTPAAYRSDQNWTHLPKIGEACFLGKSNFGLSFSWRKIALPVDSGKFRSPLPQEVFLKNRKNRRAIKTEFSVLI